MTTLTNIQDALTAERPSATADPVASGAASTTVITASGGWQLINVRELWQFRELIYFLVWRDVKVRYKQTVLGAAWAILQPAMMMIVFTIFFSSLAHVPAGDLPYPVFVYAGLLPWTFFANAVSSAGNSVVGSERLISKVYFPRLAVPLAAVGAAVVDFIIAFGLLLVLMLAYGILPGPELLLVPVFFGVILLVAQGVGTLLAALNVAYRDFRYVLPFLIQLWMFATPTVYMQLPEEPTGLAQAALACNPLLALIAAFRAAVLGGPIPWGACAIATVVALGMLFFGCLYFRKVEDSFADII
ncbi:MAG: ABC transporter permease [Gemmataceae bacterium]|nr:ABC transporter permease [Gemmataceae bacterium]